MRYAGAAAAAGARAGARARAIGQVFFLFVHISFIYELLFLIPPSHPTPTRAHTGLGRAGDSSRSRSRSPKSPKTGSRWDKASSGEKSGVKEEDKEEVKKEVKEEGGDAALESKGDDE